MRIALLGPVQVFADDASPLPVGGARLRMLLARLALEGGRPVPADALVDGLWDEEPPADAANALQALVSRLRRALRGAGTVEGAGGGYRLSVRDTDVDAHRFEELAAQGGRELAAGRAEQASSVLGAALGLWRGTALADVRDAPFADPERVPPGSLPGDHHDLYTRRALPGRRPGRTLAREAEDAPTAPCPRNGCSGPGTPR
ncbi:AfsR/SARP family transcriptional regulator [Actinomadura kijaniata]|uniref:AfsR/SARP family transcriptional regulator n=1 Tax=Actinomadura kijaniata TaxID=46161 RepID=UPI000836FA0F|nr:BTAD domain-containing putative transcriptional regulator [Actinomadura kijaniata]